MSKSLGRMVLAPALRLPPGPRRRCFSDASPNSESSRKELMETLHQLNDEMLATARHSLQELVLRAKDVERAMAVREVQVFEHIPPYLYNSTQPRSRSLDQPPLSWKDTTQRLVMDAERVVEHIRVLESERYEEDTEYLSAKLRSKMREMDASAKSKRLQKVRQEENAAFVRIQLSAHTLSDEILKAVQKHDFVTRKEQLLGRAITDPQDIQEGAPASNKPVHHSDVVARLEQAATIMKDLIFDQKRKRLGLEPVTTRRRKRLAAKVDRETRAAEGRQSTIPTSQADQFNEISPGIGYEGPEQDFAYHPFVGATPVAQEKTQPASSPSGHADKPLTADSSQSDTQQDPKLAQSSSERPKSSSSSKVDASKVTNSLKADAKEKTVPDRKPVRPKPSPAGNLDASPPADSSKTASLESSEPIQKDVRPKLARYVKIDAAFSSDSPKTAVQEDSVPIQIDADPKASPSGKVQDSATKDKIEPDAQGGSNPIRKVPGSQGWASGSRKILLSSPLRRTNLRPFPDYPIRDMPPSALKPEPETSSESMQDAKATPTSKPDTKSAPTPKPAAKTKSTSKPNAKPAPTPKSDATAPKPSPQVRP